MLTLFTIPKSFRGHIEIIQRNAIASWTLLRPRPEIILFGDDEGTAEVAKDFSGRHVPEVARNEYGTPLVNDLFEKAQRLAAYDLLCYVNTDIILMSDFMEAVQRVARRKNCFLLVGQRSDIEIRKPLDVVTGWENRLRSYVIRQGQLHPPTGIDYFVFPRGIWGEIPPFAIGRTSWDNWLIYRARARGIPVIDATDAVMVVHQNHDYSHVPSKAGDARKGPEAKRNLQFAGGWEHIFTLQDATHKLTPNGLRIALSRGHLQRHLERLPELYPYLTPLVMLMKVFIRVSRLVRQALMKITTPRRSV